MNALAEEAGVRTRSGRPVRFVPPGAAATYYEMRVFETGCIETRPDSLHDLFNALTWLAFPATKSRLNAMHAAEIPHESGGRGRRRDLLTLVDEGGVIVQCDDPQLIALVQRLEWKALFFERRARVLNGMRLSVIGHATLEQALRPWPGIACKVIFVARDAHPDAAAAAWLDALPRDATPRAMAPLPVFGYPGWFPGNDRAEFYDDTRYFRPLRERPDKAAPVPRAPLRDGAR